MISKNIFVLVFVLLVLSVARISGHPDYKDALAKSLIFFQGQRSGKLPADQKIKWRSDSGLSDGSSENVDLSGGYYDAGDNVKFGLPMAFTTTLLSWSVLEFGRRIAGELDHAREAIRWGSDYLLKASSQLPNALYVQVGDPVSDHKCWQRPEDMTTPRSVYKVTPTAPGSEVAGETAAALAAASLVFEHTDSAYSKKLLATAKKAFEFADKYRGSYNDHLSSAVCPFYCSYSGYNDELIWAAAWLYKATENSSYLDYIRDLNVDLDSTSFSWDNKRPGVNVLLAKEAIMKENEAAAIFQQHAENYVCSILPTSPEVRVKYTEGGLMYMMSGSNLQYVTTTTFLLSTYSKYLKASNKTFSCGNIVVNPSLLRQFVQKQVDYILGANPKGMSYMVGFGENFPRRIHHRGSSMPSFHLNREPIGCDHGFQFYYDANADPNLLVGAIVGGPDEHDNFADDRANYAQSEPATYINAPFVGTLAYLGATTHS